MTNEKILSELFKAGKTIKDFSVSLDIIRKNKGIPKAFGENPDFDVILANLIYTLETEEKEKGMKKAGKSDLLQAAKSVLKNAKKVCEHKPALQQAFMCGNNQVFCDGFQALILSNEKILDIETSEKEVFNVLNSIPETTEKTAILPTKTDLKLVLTEFKNLHSKQKPILRFYNEYNQLVIALNPDFVLNAINATGSNTLHFNYSKGISIVKAENVDFLLMPVRVKPIEERAPGTYYYIDVDFNGIPCITTETVKRIEETA